MLSDKLYTTVYGLFNYGDISDNVLKNLLDFQVQEYHSSNCP
jgi:hypothetical protein